ncbi:hypothetical protein LINGRAHAP2_LOCUS5083 [Linum grandiflorum]
MREQNHHNEIMQEINVESNEEIDQEINAQIIEDINHEIAHNEEMLEDKENEKRKGRGKNKHAKLGMLKRDEKLTIEFYNRRAVGPNAKVFSRSLGIIVRSPTVVPVRLMNWSALSDDDLEFVWAVAREHFTNANMAAQKDDVLRHARNLWNKARSNWYREFVEECETPQEAIRNIPPLMDKEDWKWLVEEVFLSDEFQRNIKVGKAIRKKSQLKPHSGSRPVVEKIYNHIEEYGEEPSYDTILEFLYKKGDTVQDVYAAEKIGLVRKTKEETPDATTYDLAKKCFGKQLKHGCVVALGAGVKLRDLKRNTSNDEHLVSKLRQTEEEKAILQQRLEDIEAAGEKREQEMAEVKGEVEKMKALVEALLRNRPSYSFLRLEA